MEVDLRTTILAFVAVIALGVVGLDAGGMMARNTLLMMVLPSMVIFGAIMLVIGVKHGEYRAARA